MELLLEDFHINTVIEEVTNMIKPMIKKNHNNLDIRIADNLNIMHADSMRVKQILFNLLSNACKFTQNGNIQLIIEQPDSAHIRFKVIDSGIGIEGNKINNLFQEFVQADNSTTRRYGGTGLGLSICQRLTILMGGDIRVTSSPGHGSVFIATLPLRVEVNSITDSL